MIARCTISKDELDDTIKILTMTHKQAKLETDKDRIQRLIDLYSNLYRELFSTRDQENSHASK